MIAPIILIILFIAALKALQVMNKRATVYEEELDLVPVRELTREEKIKQRSNIERIRRENLQ